MSVSAVRVSQWFSRLICTPQGVVFYNPDDDFYVNTKAGKHKLSEGDWIFSDDESHRVISHDELVRLALLNSEGEMSDPDENEGHWEEGEPHEGALAESVFYSIGDTDIGPVIGLRFNDEENPEIFMTLPCAKQMLIELRETIDAAMKLGQGEEPNA